MTVYVHICMNVRVCKNVSVYKNACVCVFAYMCAWVCLCIKFFRQEVDGFLLNVSLENFHLLP